MPKNAFQDKVTLVEGSMLVPLSRDNDYAPFFGGDHISDFDHAGFQCTSGLTLIKDDNSSTAAFTAGHCFPWGTEVWIWDGSHHFGKVTSRSLCNGCLDLAVITGESYDPSVWTGANVASVNGTYNPGVGEVVCNLGAITGMGCGTITAEDRCKPVTTGGTVCHLTSASSSTFISRGGDSGGPVVLFSGSFTLGAGTLIGGEANPGKIMYYHALRFTSQRGYHVFVRP